MDVYNLYVFGCGMLGAGITEFLVYYKQKENLPPHLFNTSYVIIIFIMIVLGGLTALGHHLWGNNLTLGTALNLGLTANFLLANMASKKSEIS